LDSVIAGDEKWILCEGFHRIRLDVREDCSANQLRSTICVQKNYYIVFYRIEGSWAIRNGHQWIRELQRRYMQVNKSLCIKRCRKNLQHRSIKKVIILQQDISRPNVTLKVTLMRLKELGWKALMYPIYYLGMVPSDYHLFLNIRNFVLEKIWFLGNITNFSINLIFV